MIPYSRAKRSDLYTLSQSKLLENHTLHSGTYLYSPYMAVPPRASVEVVLGLFLPKHCTITPERATLNLAGI